MTCEHHYVFHPKESIFKGWRCEKCKRTKEDIYMDLGIKLGRQEVKGLRDEKRGEIYQAGYDKRRKRDIRFVASMGGGMFFSFIGSFFGYDFNIFIIGLGMLFGWWVSGDR